MVLLRGIVAPILGLFDGVLLISRGSRLGAPDREPGYASSAG
jgi:hypothetical protein